MLKLDVKRLGVHAGVYVLLALGLYLGKGLLAPLKLEMVRLMAAMALGAFACKPLSNWICEKIL